jgi:hypothetical protein
LPKFIHVIFCDDVRTEQNGKKIIVGMYTGKLLTGSFPFGSKISILIIVEPPSEVTSLVIEVRLQSGAKIAEANADMPPAPAGMIEPGYLELTVPLLVSAGDVLEVWGGRSTTHLELIGRLPIEHAPPSPV